MEISKGIKIIDLALYLEKSKTLIISDIHLGYEELLKKQGYLIPLNQFEDILKRLKKIMNSVEIKRIIINGDLKHEFDIISQQEWKHTLKLLDLFDNKEVILIKGNHDNILGPIADKKNLTLKNQFDIDEITITHGNKIPKTMKKLVIIGHEHPAVSFKERIDDKYKCFLKGKYKNHTLIVMPSFNLIFPGTDIQKEELLSPFLKQDLSNFEVYVIEDKVYNFGKLKNIK